jgi:hypothetical protein
MRRTFTRWVLRLSLVAAALLTGPTTARAQPGSSDKAAAETHFQRGKAQLEEGRLEEACGQFEASQKLDPAVGTLLFLGDCYERRGQTASAWATFEEASSQASRQGQTQRQRIAGVRAAALVPQLSTLTIVVERITAGSQLQLRRNGAVIPPQSYGTALPVDPGPHRVEASAPGYESWATEVTVPGQASAVTVRVPALAETTTTGGSGDDATSQPAGASVGPAMGTRPSQDGPDSATTGPNPWLVTGVVVGAAGVGGLIAGTVFGLLAQSSNDDSLDSCRTDTLCDPTGVELREDAQDQATISTVGFVAGGVLLAGGVALIIVGASAGDGTNAEQAELAIVPTMIAGPMGLSLRGSW